MEWAIANWFWISWVLSILVIPGILGILKIIAIRTKNVHDDQIVTLLIEWWKATRGLVKSGTK